MRTRASNFGTCLTPCGANSNASEAHFGSILVAFWFGKAHFGVILWSFGVPFWGHFGLIFGSWAPEPVMVILGALYEPFRAPIWVPFWAHFWLIFMLENRSGFCTPPGSHFGVDLGLILVLFSD